MLKVDINLKDAAPKVAEAAALLKDGRPLFERISKALESVVEANFEAQGRPAWVPLAKSTVAARTKGKGGSLLKILQDTGTLASSISTEYGPDYALIGAGGAGVRHYAAVHQFGATIERPAYPTRVRLRTDQKGNLIRQGKTGSARGRAVFAKEKGDQAHKRYRQSWHQVDAYKFTIPARPYLPFPGTATGATIQPEAARSILDAATSLLGQAFD